MSKRRTATKRALPPLFSMTMMMMLASHRTGSRAGVGVGVVDAFGLQAPDVVQHVREWTDAIPFAAATTAATAPNAIDGFGSSLLTCAAAGESSPSTLLRSPSLSLSSSLSLSQADIWTLRIGSALATYFGFVAVTDRPRGSLALPLDTGDGDASGNGSGNSNANSIASGGFLRVGPSTVPGAGLGLFATTDLLGGTVLGTYPGVVLPLQQHSASSKIRDHPECLAYIWRFTDNKFVIDPTASADGTLRETCAGGNPSQLGSVTFFSLLGGLGIVPRPSTALCRINEPPLGRDINVVTEEDLEKRTVTFLLERDVFAGEELHIDYGLTYDRSGYGR